MFETKFAEKIVNKILTDLFNQLFNHYGKQHWWPAETREEVIIGAVLTQNTNWTNVTRAITNLKNHNLCSLEKLTDADVSVIAGLIKPSGYYNLKAERLKTTAKALKAWKPDDLPLSSAREYLLAIKGIGEETADSILLYAYGLPVFVIDSYTIRLLGRLGLSVCKKDYPAAQRLFMDNLPADTELFNEYHALIVRHCKAVCRKKPLCGCCSLNQICRFEIADGSP